MSNISLNNDDIVFAINNAITSKDGLDNKVKITKEAALLLASYSSGDLRFALNKLEIASFVVKENETITEDTIKSIIKKANITIDKDEDGHYDAVSALQKSIRGSDVHASLYYLGRLIIGGELDSICRRMAVIVYEDIGLDIILHV